LNWVSKCASVTIRRAEHRVEVEEVRVALGFQVDGPVVRSRQSEWPGCNCSGDVDVALANPQEQAVLRACSPLHRRGDHHAGECGADPWIDRREHHCLRGASARAGDENAFGIDVREAEHEIERADAVPGLQTEIGLQAGGRLRN